MKKLLRFIVILFGLLGLAACIALFFCSYKLTEKANGYKQLSNMLLLQSSNGYNDKYELDDIEKDITGRMNQLKEELKLNPKNAKAYFEVGYIYKKLYNEVTATKYFDKAIELDPKYADAYANRGYCYIIRKKYIEALKDLDYATQLDPKNIKAQVNLADVKSILLEQLAHGSKRHKRLLPRGISGIAISLLLIPILFLILVELKTKDIQRQKDLGYLPQQDWILIIPLILIATALLVYKIYGVLQILPYIKFLL